MSKNKSKLLVLALAVVMCIGIVGISAYFTDADTATNTFTVGKVSLDLQEPSWTPPEDIKPNDEFEKDPQIKNDGVNDEYVFVEVIIPYENVTTAQADGTKNTKAFTELFAMLKEDGSVGVNDGWVEIGTAKRDEAAKTVTHLYAYGTNAAMTSLAANGTTNKPLFSKVRFANVIEDEGLEGSTKNIVINAYGIQTTNINGGKTAPADVWAVVSNQVPSKEVTGEAANTDIKPAA